MKTGLCHLLQAGAGSALAMGFGMPEMAIACPKDFPCFDTFVFTGKPDLAGLTKTMIAYGSDLWPNGASRDAVPTSAAIQAFLQANVGFGNRLIVDIEGDWPLYGVSSSVLSASISKYQSLKPWFNKSTRH